MVVNQGWPVAIFPAFWTSGQWTRSDDLILNTWSWSDALKIWSTLIRVLCLFSKWNFTRFSGVAGRTEGAWEEHFKIKASLLLYRLKIKFRPAFHECWGNEISIKRSAWAKKYNNGNPFKKNYSGLLIALHLLFTTNCSGCFLCCGLMWFCCELRPGLGPLFCCCCDDHFSVAGWWTEVPTLHYARYISNMTATHLGMSSRLLPSHRRFTDSITPVLNSS